MPAEFDREAAFLAWWAAYFPQTGDEQMPPGLVTESAWKAAWAAAERAAREECIDELRTVAHVERLPMHMTSRQVLNYAADTLAVKLAASPAARTGGM